MTAIVTQNQQALATRGYSGAQLQLIKNTIAKDCNDMEFDLFIEMSKHQGLDPFKKQVYPFVFKTSKRVKTPGVNGGKDVWTTEDERKLTLVTAIDGYRAKADRTGLYRPDENEPSITIEAALIDPALNPQGIEKATVTVWKYGPDQKWHPIKGVAYWEEYAPIIDDGAWQEVEENGYKNKKFVPNGKQVLDPKKSNWRRMGKLMLAKCAEANALRKGWPDVTSGLYVSEEIDRADASQTAMDRLEAFEKEERMKRVGSKDTIPAMFNITEGIVFVPSGQYFDEVMKHLKTFERSTDVEMWRGQNRHGLQQFWGVAKSDALALKREIENLEASLLEKEIPQG